MDSQYRDELVSDNSRLVRVERSVSRFKYLLIGSILLNAALLVVLLFVGGVNVFSRRIHARDVVLEGHNGRVAAELGVKKDWDGFSTGKYYPEIRFYDDAGKAAMVTSGTGTSFSYGDSSVAVGFTGISISGKNRNILINPDTFSFANDNGSVLMIDPTQTGFDLSASANGNSFGLLAYDKGASMYVSDPKAEVDITAEDGKPEINRILTNRNLVQPVQ
jgi:hypothetical protein